MDVVVDFRSRRTNLRTGKKKSLGRGKNHEGAEKTENFHGGRVM